MFFFNDTATTEIYTLSLHDALPICVRRAAVVEEDPRTAVQPAGVAHGGLGVAQERPGLRRVAGQHAGRSEEHTSELQSRQYLVCRLLFEKKIRRLSLSTSTLTISSR